MSGYVPKPDQEGINNPPSTPLKDAMILFIGFIAIAGTLVAALTFLGGWAAQKLSPEMEAKIFSKLEDLSNNDLEKRSAREAFRPLLTKLFGRQDRNIKVFIMCQETPNAFAVPGGVMLITSGLIKSLNSENGLAFVVGHELGHFKHRDHLTGMGRGLGLMIAAAFLGLAGSDGFGLDITKQMIGNSFNRQQETAADNYSLELMQLAYGHFSGAEEFFKYILESKDAWQGKIPSFLSTHPNPKERLALIVEKQKTLTGEPLPLSDKIKAAISACE